MIREYPERGERFVALAFRAIFCNPYPFDGRGACMRYATICDADVGFGDALAILIRGAVADSIHVLRFSSAASMLAHPHAEMPEVIFIDSRQADKSLVRTIFDTYGPDTR